MAAFALGLIGGPGARAALVAALADAHPIVQGRAAQALGRLGFREDATPIATMVRTHIDAGVIAEITPDYARDGQSAADAVRLGLVALGGLGSFDAVATAALGRDGAPVSTWWPVAYALRQSADPRVVGPLRTLMASPGRYTKTLAIQGLGALKAREAVADLLRLVAAQPGDSVLVLASLSALRLIADPQAAPVLLALAADGAADPLFRVEALGALESMAPLGGVVDVLLDLLSDRVSAVRGAAFKALAWLDTDAFVSAIAGLDPDSDWKVRVAQAEALATLPAARALPALMARLQDPDQRVVAPILKALAATDNADVVPGLLAGLEAEDLIVRAEAARGLGAMKVTSAVPALVRALEAWKQDPLYVARVAALEALVGLDARAAVPALRAALADRDWAVRVRAAELAAAIPAGGGDVLLPADAGLEIRPAPPSREISVDDWAWLLSPPYSPRVRVETDRGAFEFELDVIGAPQTVANFIDLARKKFFDGVPFHRVVPNFVVQGGDPRGDGEGGPGYTIRDELNLTMYVRGTVGMALDWRDTGGSRFFVTLGPQPQLDGRFTAFGKVVEGMAVVDQLRVGDVMRMVTVSGGR
jgi:cyclophilin family peptidyl-prolyl cis-trans isomerase/HEAT repeat protein